MNKIIEGPNQHTADKSCQVVESRVNSTAESFQKGTRQAKMPPLLSQKVGGRDLS